MKQARLAAGWLKYKKKLLPVLIIVALVSTITVPAFIPRATAIVNPGGGASSANADALWLDNYKTLVYNGTSFTGGSGAKARFLAPADSDGCQAAIKFNSDYKTARTATYVTAKLVSQAEGLPGVCTYAAQGTIISVDSTANNPKANGTAAGGGAGSTDALDPCDASGNPLSWFVCPLVGLLNEGTIQMQHIIDNLMAVDITSVFDTTASPGKNYYAAWNSFRLFGVVLIIIAGLVMVISQALGMDIFDAYTVKKVMPRLFVAAIGISLSWWLLKYLAQFTNDLGLGIRGVIYYPFRDMGNAGLQNTGSYLITLMFGSVALWALSIGGVLSLVLTAGLAALVAFVVLVIRQIVLIFLILIAPLAIACYVLPNTEKAYKLWWDSLSKGMLMFPIISGFIAMGRVFSVVASNSGNGLGNSINQVIALIAFFLPYFALPFTFRLAGGAIATIGGLANDRSRGAFDGLKKYRGNKTAENFHKTKEGTRFNNTSFVGKRLNRGTRAIATAPSAGLNPIRMRERYSAANGNKIADEAELLRSKNADFMSGANDTRVLKAIMEGGNQGRSGLIQSFKDQGMDGAEINTAVGVAERMMNSGSKQSVMAAAAIQRAGTGDGYEDVGEMLDSIASASGGDRSLGGRMLGQMRGIASQTGRQDLGAAGFGKMAGELGKVYNTGPGSADVRMLQRDAFESADATTIARGRGESVKNISTAVSEYINSDADVNTRARYSAQLKNLTDNAREYGSLSRAHDIHQYGVDNLLPGPADQAQANPEYGAHRSRYGDTNSPNNPNRQEPDK